MKKIILASQSPRRSEILKKANYDFVSIPTHVSEIPDVNLTLNEQIVDIARRKARFCLALLQDQGLGSIAGTSPHQSYDLKQDIVLAADTMVCIADKILGKPESHEEAFLFLKMLSGQIHQVKTAVILIDIASQDEVSILETTQVTFRDLTETEIWDYIRTGEPMDKAGAYAIQGLAEKFVTRFDGDFDNVVGLPLQAIEKVFKIKLWTLKRLHPVRKF